MAVMMQRFYWDCAIKEQKRGEWRNFLNSEIRSLVNMVQVSIRFGYRLFQSC